MHQPRIKRAGNRPRHTPPIAHPHHQRAIPPRHMAKQHIAMASGGLGIGGHHQIGPQIQGALKQRCHGGVIHNHPRPCRARARGHIGNIHHIQKGVGWAFDINRSCPRKICPPIVLSRQKLHIHPHRAQKILGKNAGNVIAIHRQNNTATHRQTGHQCRRNRGHARGKSQTWRIFQQRQLRLYAVPCRVARTGIKMPPHLHLGQMIGR